MKVKKIFFLLIFSCLLLSYSVYASDYGTTGKIAGKVVDKSTNQILIGVNIIVKGTSLGAATDDDGLYTIIMIPPGTYELEVSYIGYKTTTVQNVKVQVDLTTRVEIEMEQTTLELDEVITVVAERPLIQHDVTSTSHKTTREEIVDIPTVQSSQDVLTTMPGVVGDGEAISARGGRSGEIVYMIDGVPVNDPLYHSQTLEVNKYAIQEIELQTGGFNAEYGDVQSGIVNIVTRSGGRKLSGRFAFFTDDFGSGKFTSEQDPFDMVLRVAELDGVEKSTSEKWYKPLGTGMNTFSQNTDRLEFNLGGPEIFSNNILPALGLNFLKGKVDFFLSGTVESKDGYLPNGSQRSMPIYEAYTEKDEYDNETVIFELDQNGDPISGVADHALWLPIFPGVFGEGGLFKWGGKSRNNFNFNFSANINVSGNKKVTINYLNSQFGRSSFNHRYKYTPWKNFINFGRGNTLTLGWSHTLSTNSFYQIRLARFDNFRETIPGMHNGWLYRPGLHTQDIAKGLGDSYSTGEAGPPEYIGKTDYGVDASGMIMDDSFFSGMYKYHMPPPAIDGGGGYGYENWQINDTKTYTLKIDYLNQVTPHHEIKTGIMAKYMDLKHQRIESPNVVGSRNWENTEGPWPQHGALRDMYRRYPNSGSFYLQDKVEYETLIVNMGLRYDHWDPGENALKPDGSGDLATVKRYLSPRLGVSHPITERAVLYFFYGRFLKFTDYSDLYRRQNRFRINQDQINLFGNPDLEPEETTSYEVGLDWQIMEDF